MPTREARNLYGILKINFGKRIISGQAENANTSDDRDHEFKYLKQLTGKTPAIRLFDLIFYTGKYPFEDGTIDRAIDWATRGGIVAFQWHWRPSGIDDFYQSSMTSSGTPFNITKAVTTGTLEYNKALSDIATIISKLRILQTAKIPILFRPLHEANGGWFWWGAEGPTPYKKLWSLIQSQFAAANIHNVIWVHNFATSINATWYVGNDKCDIVSTDRYAKAFDYSAYPVDFYTMKNLTGGTKLLAVAENGPTPDPASMVAQNAMWSYFATWNGDYILTEGYTTDVQKLHTFQHPKVVNLEDLYL
ncbi:hypothetical protein HDV00_002921 [Rhizophlyctis rosea]|nr:hypothetical protein HDV00_002921 [Rhizophlyctis rosea]